MIADVRLFLGKGLYTVTEAAFLARVPKGTMRRWIFGRGDRKAIITPQVASDSALVSFLDFVQSLAIRNIRVQYGVSARKIREAMRLAQHSFDLPHPFAMRHTVYRWGNELAICPPTATSSDARSFIEASGKHKGSRLLGPIVENYLDDLTFDAETGLATTYTIFRHDNVRITMDPTFRFGEPLLPSGYSASTIWEAAHIEGGIEPAAKAYGIGIDEVRAAVRCFDYLASIPVATA
jgi:hypothetical protein